MSNLVQRTSGHRPEPIQRQATQEWQAPGSMADEDALRRNEFAPPAEPDSRLESDETQVRSSMRRQAARRGLGQSIVRREELPADLVTCESSTTDDVSVVSVGGATGGGEESGGGHPGDRHRRERRFAPIAEPNARAFQHSGLDIPAGPSDKVRELVMNVRGVVQQEAAPRLAAALAHCMLVTINDAETDGRERNGQSQAIEQHALRQLLQDCRLPLRATMPGVKTAILAAGVQPRAAWQRSDAGDRARILLPLVLMQIFAHSNNRLQGDLGTAR